MRTHTWCNSNTEAGGVKQRWFSGTFSEFIEQHYWKLLGQFQSLQAQTFFFSNISSHFQKIERAISKLQHHNYNQRCTQLHHRWATSEQRQHCVKLLVCKHSSSSQLNILLVSSIETILQCVCFGQNLWKAKATDNKGQKDTEQRWIFCTVI